MAEQSVTSFLKIQTAKVYDDERGLNVVRNLFFVSTPPLGHPVTVLGDLQPRSQN